MLYFRKMQRLVSSLLIMLMLSLGVSRISMAGIVTTEQLVDAQQVSAEREQIRDWLARDEVRKQLTTMGVDVKAAQGRVDSMTAQEVHAMADNMKNMPAGAGALETAVLVLLILILLDIAGVTDIFPNI
ncbi:MAG: PA2779 family protein [Gammaproteobacteria bacterium]|nr:PA2779 family protein [Gammaproteobacteria bacterium]